MKSCVDNSALDNPPCQRMGQYQICNRCVKDRKHTKNGENASRGFHVILQCVVLLGSVPLRSFLSSVQSSTPVSLFIRDICLLLVGRRAACVCRCSTSTVHDTVQRLAGKICLFLPATPPLPLPPPPSPPGYPGSAPWTAPCRHP